MRLVGLSRQIVLTMAAIALGVTLLVVLTSYTFYYVAFTYWPDHFDPASWVPTTGAEWIWLVATTFAGLVIAIAVAVNLARRILVPLNSVADGIRRVAKGDLNARAIAGDRSLGEAALLADDFNALADELQRVTEEQRFWNAAIAHELRTPVTILRGRLQGLAEGLFTPDETQFRSLLTQVEGLARLIEDLRVISLAESRHLDLQIRETDLSAEITEIVEVFSSSLASAGQHPVLDLDERRVRCDAVRIRQALLVLLENARQHASPGAIHIRTRLDDGWCHLIVEDEGPGIPDGFVPHLFTAFRRADSTRSGGRKGSGLGLAVVSSIARAHGGQVGYAPSAKGGAQFKLSWPSDSGFGMV
ncbi:two-component sensor histidine kinase (plasmid) [Azospirillum sp. B510]|uniref:ATP-binding protein n=1 Tax=Azospirillum sp. (strain B510) TaxID=137722 RepID=UPI0001C4CEAE|nr:ATP-binding protein [Azospirillum sp. B510]BAI76604.1 two-component sensor histidine kinase [Azospirillum sp. B510]